MTEDRKNISRDDRNIADIASMSDSSEVMMAKAPHSITIFIIIVLVIFITAFVWAYFGKMDTYITATGEVRPAEGVSTLSVANSGMVAAIYYSDGDTVEEGAIIMQLDGDYYRDEKEKAEGQIKDREETIEKYGLLAESIKTDTNLFDEDENPSFYYQYESYKTELSGTMLQIENSNSQVSASAGEIDAGISQASEAADAAYASYCAYLELYNAVNSDVEYTGTDSAMKNLYGSYSSSRTKAKITYDTAVENHENLKKMLEEGTATEEQVETARKQAESAKADYDGVKSSMLVQLDGEMQSLLSSITSYGANIDSYNAKKNGLVYDNTADVSRESIRNKYLTNITASTESLEQEIESLESTVREAEEMLSQLELKAGTTGTLVLAKEYVAGDMVAAGDTVATVVPETDTSKVTLYIPERYIAEVAPGQEVEYVFSAISQTDYGKVYGRILSVSADSMADSEGNRYYRAEATIDTTVLKGKDGDTREIKSGMITEAHAITGKQRIISWLLDKLNFN